MDSWEGPEIGDYSNYKRKTEMFLIKQGIDTFPI